MLSRALLGLAGALVLVSGLIGFAFAGSPSTLAEGVHIASVDVGGLRPSEARGLLERRAAALAGVPVTFVAGERRWRLTPARIGVTVDWAAAVDAARRQGDGFGPVRGFRRLQRRFFGADVAPPTHVYDAALGYELNRLAAAVAREPREAAIELRGLHPVLVGGLAGSALERRSAERVVVRALAAFSRAPVGLPVRLDPPTVSADALRPLVAQARTALSAPVRLRLGTTRWRLPRWRIAELLELPRAGRTALAIGGPGAERYFERLAKHVRREPTDAGFAVSGSAVSVTPAQEGRSLDVAATSSALLRAVLSPTRRVAPVTVETAAPERTTAEASAMGITGLVGGYTTTYGGEPNRLHNVRLVARLIDGKLIAPGSSFSFNATTGERTVEKGFLEAPVIINGELQNGLGGGVCQVSTTVFNAAYDAGLSIDSRTNHALYISHYPLGRDATVNYPDLDLRFANDTGRWLLLRTFVGDDSLTVNLYGAPANRRVESETGPLVEVAQPPVKRIADPGLYVGESVIEDGGEPARATSVRRRVYDADGKLMYDTTWRSSYRAEPATVRVGTKPKPKPKPKPKAKAKLDKQAPAAKTGPETTPTAPGTTTPEPSSPAPAEQPELTDPPA